MWLPAFPQQVPIWYDGVQYWDFHFVAAVENRDPNPIAWWCSWRVSTNVHRGQNLAYQHMAGYLINVTGQQQYDNQEQWEAAYHLHLVDTQNFIATLVL